MNCFKEIGYVDHQCFFALYEMLDAQGRLINPERLDYESALLKRRLRAAARDGVQVYHVFGRSLIEFLTYEAYEVYPKSSPFVESAKRFLSAFNECLELAKELGIRIGFSINQFTFADAVYRKFGDKLSGEGDGAARVCPANDFAWELYRSMLNEFFTACPGIDIIQLTTNETQVNVVDCKCPKCAHMDIGDRIETITRATYEVCKAHEVELQLRSWGEMEDEGFFDRISDAIPDDIAVSVKNTQGDFHLFLPMHKMIGYGNRSQIVEFDAWREFSGWNGVPCFMGYRYQERLRKAAALGVERLTLRVTWLPNHRLLEEVPWGNDLNRRAFLALCEDLDLDMDAWLKDALGEFTPFPNDKLFKLYQDSSDLLQKSYYPDELYLHSHSTVSNPWEGGNTALQEIIHWSNAAWFVKPPTAERLLEVARINATDWEQRIQAIASLEDSLNQEVYEDLLINAKGQRYLLEILPRLVLLRVWLESPEPIGSYCEAINHLRDLALKWQTVAPQHFEDKLGHFVFKAVHEARLWLESRRPAQIKDLSDSKLQQSQT